MNKVKLNNFYIREYDAKKTWVVELLVSQGLACIENYLIEKKEDEVDLNGDDLTKSALFDDLKSVYVSIQKWIDINDEKCAKFTVKFFLVLGMYGKALKILFKQLEDKSLSQVQASEQTILKVGCLL